MENKTTIEIIGSGKKTIARKPDHIYNSGQIEMLIIFM